MSRKIKILAGAVLAIVALDIVTKQWALAALPPGRSILLLEEWFGDGLPLTLAFNTGAAFGMHVGAASRWFFLVLSVVALAVFLWMYFETRRENVLRLVAIAFVVAGAIGNLIDRVRWDRGVVDFVGPVDLGFMRWPIFNVADSTVTVGAVLLVISIIRDERRLRRQKKASVDEEAERAEARA